MKGIWGTYAAGISWRYYAPTRFVGGFGIDLELMKRGFQYAPYASYYEEKSDFKYYKRTYNTIMMPIVWQPHFYMFKKHFRFYLEAAFVLSYNISASFNNKEPLSFGPNRPETPVENISGNYPMRIERDNRLGYGLAGGAGFDLIFGHIEFGLRARYDFGYADVMKNRNKYYDNNLDQQNSPGENPFYLTPLRSPLDNLTISIKIAYRFGKGGYSEWNVKRKKYKLAEPLKFGI